MRKAKIFSEIKISRNTHFNDTGSYWCQFVVTFVQPPRTNETATEFIARGGDKDILENLESRKKAENIVQRCFKTD